MLPAGGWLAIAFPTDNPGAWLMHCHIAWHISEGMAINVIDKNVSKIDFPSSIAQTCRNWSKWTGDHVVDTIDSGL